MSWIFGTAATLTSLAGLGGLLYSWRARPPKPVALRSLGWGLLVAALGLWLLAQPTEFAVTFALFVPALLAWGLILLRAQARQPARDTKLEQRGFRWPALAALARQLWLLLVSVPLAAVASALVSLAVTDWLPWERVNTLVLGVLLAPALWGAASYWACADPKRWRPALTLLIVGLLAAAYLFL